MTGHWTGWHKDGQIEGEGNYSNGYKTGKWTFWCPVKKNMREEHYLN
jgi:antitoxin component YwqK of YwqJK toxin-antitoxin module